jgi:hypothetical protein
VRFLVKFLFCFKDLFLCSRGDNIRVWSTAPGGEFSCPRILHCSEASTEVCGKQNPVSSLVF